MPNTSIPALYDYMLQQMAAESYFEEVPLVDLAESGAVSS